MEFKYKTLGKLLVAYRSFTQKKLVANGCFSGF